MDAYLQGIQWIVAPAKLLFGILSRRMLGDPGSLNYIDNHCISGLAIYSVVPIQETQNFLIIFLHRRSNFDEPYKMMIYESTIDSWYHASEPPNPNNFILQQSVVIGRRVYWINLAGEFPHKPLSLLSYSTVDGSWLVGPVPPELQISNSPRLVSIGCELYYIDMERTPTNHQLHIKPVSIDKDNKFQWGPLLTIPSHDLFTIPRISIHDYLFGFCRRIIDVFVKTSTVSSIKIHSKIILKMINKTTESSWNQARLNSIETLSSVKCFTSSLPWDNSSNTPSMSAYKSSDYV
ncbi:hypothetical protein PIB30_083150 [Stylosanthes scabra]|uniref:Uncharacterized protein n=1 Tax=Stylosanthes scabra TaxID=79078 RepID=A0ABU6XSQ8_9FABA|nr:hypothetical protein [Stylosanthes scabra]